MTTDNKDIDAARNALRMAKTFGGRGQNLRQVVRLLNELVKRREEAWRPPIDDLSDLTLRANNALIAEYAEDAENLGREVLALVAELRMARPFVRAAKQIWIAKRGRDLAKALTALDEIADNVTPISAGSRIYHVQRVFHGVGSGEYGSVLYANTPRERTGPLGGIPLAEVLDGSTLHGAVVRVTVELLKPGGDPPPNPWLTKKRRR